MRTNLGSVVISRKEIIHRVEKDEIKLGGDNCIFNVEPARTCCANIIYNDFVRRFGSPYAALNFTEVDPALAYLYLANCLVHEPSSGFITIIFIGV